MPGMVHPVTDEREGLLAYLARHAGHADILEVIHHAAEVATLRELYRAGGGCNLG